MNISGRLLLGRYTEGESILHRADARAKLFFILSVSAALFITSGLRGFAAPALLFIAAAAFSGTPPLRLLRGLAPVIWLLLFTFLLNYFAASLDRAVFFSLRLLILFSWASLFTATTRAADTGRAIAWYLKPLRVLGISPERTAFAFTMALRFFPLVLEEAESILKAQKVKPVKLSPVRKLTAFCSVFMIRVLRKADAIEDSLDNRGILEGDISFLIENPSPVKGTAAVAVLLSLSCIYLAL